MTAPSPEPAEIRDTREDCPWKCSFDSPNCLYLAANRKLRNGDCHRPALPAPLELLGIYFLALLCVKAEMPWSFTGMLAFSYGRWASGRTSEGE